MSKVNSDMYAEIMLLVEKKINVKSEFWYVGRNYATSRKEN